MIGRIISMMINYEDGTRNPDSLADSFPVEVAAQALEILRQHAQSYEQRLAGPLTLAELHY
ncbi:hypothetical protein B484DRAFT_398423 [Ochromonadaceae sp. CCMP2298]|nr:hypothetical protein B484DRAFT_398423 [Ochromonadaceae sp. CCMP2298]